MPHLGNEMRNRAGIFVMLFGVIILKYFNETKRIVYIFRNSQPPMTSYILVSPETEDSVRLVKLLEIGSRNL